MATIDLGKLGFVNKGTYNNSTTYEKNDLVQFTDGGILSTYLYIDSTAQSGQAPSSSGTVGSRWVFFAKGVADAIASAGNNKVLVTDGSGNLSPLSIGSAGQAIKVNSSANGYEFGTAGGVLQVKQMTTDAIYTVNRSDWNDFNSAFKLNFTPTASDSRYLLECYLSLGMESHDGMYTLNWWDSQKGTSASDTIVPISTYSSNRTQGSFALFPAGAGVSASWDEYWLSGHYVSYMYYPDTSERNTNARDFIPVIKRCSGHSFNIKLNIPHNNSNLNKSGISMIRVTELAGGIIS
jgi:hypothetical protein